MVMTRCFAKKSKGGNKRKQEKEEAREEASAQALEFDFEDFQKKLKKHVKHFEDQMTQIKLANRINPDTISEINVS